MDQATVKATILQHWLLLPESHRRTEQDAAGFVLHLMVEHPELARLASQQQPYKLIKTWVCETLPTPQPKPRRAVS